MRREAEAKAKEIIPALFVDGNREGSGISVSRREAARTVTLGDEQIVRIIDGDRGAQYPKKSDFSPRGHCLFLNTSNVRRGSWDFSKCDFISSQKDQSLRKGKLQRGDVILTTRGTLGYSAHFDARVPFDHVRINSGMVLLRTNPDVLLPEYLLGLVNSRTFEQQVESLTSGSAQPQLPIRALTKIAFTLPEISTQRLIASRFNQASDLWITQRSATALSEHAFQSLLAGVFGAES
jgi:type I restriction enzyme S subunit